MHNADTVLDKAPGQDTFCTVYKNLLWDRCGIYVSWSCGDYVMKHVEMSRFFHIGISNITNLCYVRSSDVEKTKHFHMFPHVIST